MAVTLSRDQHEQLWEFFDGMKASDKLPDHIKAIFGLGLEEAEVDRSLYEGMLAEEAESVGTPGGWAEALGDVAGPEDLAEDCWRP